MLLSILSHNVPHPPIFRPWKQGKGKILLARIFIIVTSQSGNVPCSVWICIYYGIKFTHLLLDQNVTYKILFYFGKIMDFQFYIKVINTKESVKRIEL